MPPQTHTFPCPFCGRRMGVGLDLLGRQVRCPHCKQVVVAPAAASPLPPDPDPANQFGFGTTPTSVRQPPRPAPAPPPETTPAADNPFSFGPSPAAAPPPPPPRPAPPKPAVPPMPEAANAPVRGNSEESFTFDIPAKSVAPRPAVPPPPPPVAPPPEPVFTFPHREKADSILSDPEESEDHVFGSGSGARSPVVELPELPPDPPPAPSRPTPVSPPPAPAADPFTFAAPKPAPPPSPPPPAAPVPRNLVETAALPNPFAEPEPTPSLPPPPPPKPAAPTPRPPTPAAPANPWAGLDAMTSPTEPLPHVPAFTPAPMPAPARAPQPAQAEPLPLDAEPEETTRPARGRPPADATVRLPKAAVYGLVGYALLMTLLAVYGLFIKSGDKLESGHPLSTIPDHFGEFDPAARKKVTMYKFPVDGDLPADLRAGLGGKIEVGQLVVEPVGVEKRRVTAMTANAKPLGSMGEALALKLRVTNTSPDLAIFPLDPAFARREKGDDRPATRLVVGRKVFPGGTFPWPPPQTGLQIDAAQAGDAVALKPGETRDYVVLSPAMTKGQELIQAVANSRDPILWRVEVRRGLVEFRGKERPVNAIVGVEFTKDDVKGLE